MSVLPGEGTHPILYGSTTLSARTQIHFGYLARPDLAGAYPTSVVVPTAAGITSGIKALCRRMARQGMAAVAYDIYRGEGPRRGATAEDIAAAYAALSDARVLADLDDVYRFLRGPGTEWADPHRLGVFGVGTGGRFAVLSAGERPYIGAVVVTYAPLIDDPGRATQADTVLPDLGAPLLGLHGKEDDVVAIDQAMAARELIPASEWVLYENGVHGFLDDGAAGYDEAITSDAVDRAVAFFSRHLGAVPAAPAPEAEEQGS